MSWWRRLFCRGRLEDELDAELRHHLEAQIREQVRAGMSEEAARRKAAVDFGSLNLAKEECRDVRHLPVIDALAMDLRFGIRMLGRRPLFAVTIVLLLGLAIGFNATLFTLVDGLVFQTPSGLTAHQELVSVPNSWLLTHEQYAQLEAAVRLVDLAGWSHRQESSIGTGADAERIQVRYVTASFFPVLGVMPSSGRAFIADDFEPASSLTAILGFEYWNRQLAGDPAIVGQPFRIGGEIRTIVGVAPPRFTGVGTDPIDAWLPAVPPRQVSGGIHLLGRLAPGATITQAISELRSVYPEGAPVIKETSRSGRPELVPVHEPLWVRLRSLDPMIFYLVAAGLASLLVASANISGMLVHRAFERRHEIAVRTQLGASRGRIVGQLFAELIPLTVAGTCLAVLMSRWTLPLLRTILTSPLPGIHVRSNFPDLLFGLQLESYGAGEGLNTIRVLLATGALAVICTLISGLAPAVYAQRTDPGWWLNSGLRPESGTSHLRPALLSFQVALAVTLILSTTLFVRSFRNASEIDHGIASENVLAVEMDLRQASFESEEARRVFHAMEEALRNHPDVTHVSTTSSSPIGGSRYFQSWEIPGYELADGAQPVRTWVSPEYFDLLGIPIVEGRVFTDLDVRNGAPVLIVSERFARERFRGESPIGRCVQFVLEEDCRTIIGVTGSVRRDVASRAGIDIQDGDAAFYGPAAPGLSVEQLLIRTRTDPGPLMEGIRRVLQEADPAVPFISLNRLTSYEGQQIHGWRVGSTLFGGFGMMAIVLATVGTYTFLASVVRQRRAELGIRLALGATPSEICLLTLRTGMAPLFVGVAAGLALALVFATLIAGLLFGVAPTDAVSVAGTVALMIGTGLIACLGPALQAGRTDPADSLRYQ